MSSQCVRGAPRGPISADEQGRSVLCAGLTPRRSESRQTFGRKSWQSHLRGATISRCCRSRAPVAGHLGKIGLKLTEEVLAARRRLYPESHFPDGHPELIQSLNSLGYHLDKVGRPDLALPHFEQALALSRKLYPEKTHSQLLTGHLCRRRGALLPRSRSLPSLRCYAEAARNGQT
jgi:hypothetical protein